MSYVDLHIHSHYSDGVFSPKDLIRMAVEKHLTALAICDHDNIQATDEALREGAAAKIEVLTGVELSTVHRNYEDLHLLGYNFDHHDTKLTNALQRFQTCRETRTLKIMNNINQRLAEEGKQPLDFAFIRSQAQGALGRPHIARALIREGYVRDVPDAFERYLRLCNEPKHFFPAAEALELILGAGGVPVLAHPYLLTRDMKKLEALCLELIPQGLKGIEAWSSGATADETAQFITLARRHGLIVTGGSDFHGFDADTLTIGTGRGNLRVPYQCVKEIRQECEKQKRCHEN